MIVAAAMAAATAAISSWHDARTIVLAPLAAPTYVRLVLPQSIDGGPSGRYPDLRIADAANREVPYALDASPARTAGEAVALSDVGFVKGAYTQAIADLGDSGALHSAIALRTSQPTYFERVEIASSDDRRTWTVLVRKALIYRVAQTQDAGTATIDFGPSRARWLRIRVLDGSRYFPILGASAEANAPLPQLVPLEGRSSIKQGANQTVVTFALAAPNTDLGAVAFETRTPEFSRGVAFASSDAPPGKAPDWQAFDAATISRFTAGRPQLTVDLGHRRTREVRVTVDNGNDEPLRDLRVTPLGYQHVAIFRAEPNVTYRLLWNGPTAQAPTYDLAQRLAHESWSVGAAARVGAVASAAFLPNSLGPPTAPWLQRAALPLALLVGCIVLGGIALTALRAR